MWTWQCLEIKIICSANATNLWSLNCLFWCTFGYHTIDFLSACGCSNENSCTIAAEITSKLVVVLIYDALHCWNPVPGQNIFALIRAIEQIPKRSTGKSHVNCLVWLILNNRCDVYVITDGRTLTYKCFGESFQARCFEFSAITVSNRVRDFFWSTYSTSTQQNS